MKGKSFKHRPGKPIGKKVGKSEVLEGFGDPGSGSSLLPTLKGGTLPGTPNPPILDNQSGVNAGMAPQSPT